MTDQERLDRFERMLKEITEKMDSEAKLIEQLKAEGKEKTATCRQYMGNRMMYRMIMDQYRKYGLID